MPACWSAALALAGSGCSPYWLKNELVCPVMVVGTSEYSGSAAVP